MKTLVLNADEVSELLPIKECIAVMREALIALAAGKVHQPLRTIIRPPGAKGVMGLMPSYTSEVRGQDSGLRSQNSAKAAFGLKAICVFPGNPAIGMDSHQGAVLLFSAETGELLAMMNASAITAIRTAAVSACGDRPARPSGCLQSRDHRFRCAGTLAFGRDGSGSFHQALPHRQPAF